MSHRLLPLLQRRRPGQKTSASDARASDSYPHPFIFPRLSLLLLTPFTPAARHVLSLLLPALRDFFRLTCIYACAFAYDASVSLLRNLLSNLRFYGSCVWSRYTVATSCWFQLISALFSVSLKMDKVLLLLESYPYRDALTRGRRNSELYSNLHFGLASKGLLADTRLEKFLQIKYCTTILRYRTKIHHPILPHQRNNQLYPAIARRDRIQKSITSVSAYSRAPQPPRSQ